jgi:YopX protein
MEIKFRALKDDKADVTFQYGCLIYNEQGEPRILTDVKNELFTTCVRGTEGQYTNLPDADDEEIYVGDIVVISGHFEGDLLIAESYCEVVFADGAYFAVDPGQNKWYPLNEVVIDAYQIRVVGNVHLNKDLIKTS